MAWTGNLIGHNRGETREDRTGKEDVCYKLNIFFIERDQPCDNESQCEENMFSPVFSQKFDSSKNSIIEFWQTLKDCSPSCYSYLIPFFKKKKLSLFILPSNSFIVWKRIQDFFTKALYFPYPERIISFFPVKTSPAFIHIFRYLKTGSKKGK